MCKGSQNRNSICLWSRGLQPTALQFPGSKTRFPMNWNPNTQLFKKVYFFYQNVRKILLIFLQLCYINNRGCFFKKSYCFITLFITHLNRHLLRARHTTIALVWLSKESLSFLPLIIVDYMVIEQIFYELIMWSNYSYLKLDMQDHDGKKRKTIFTYFT